MRLVLPLLITLALAAPAMAQTAGQNGSPSRTGAAALQTPLPLRPPVRVPGDDPSLTSPGLRRLPLVATARLGRGASDAQAQCRATCATPYYACRRDIDSSRCGPAWTQCLTECRTVPPAVD